MRPILSIVLPCLNESETLEICIQKSLKSIADIGILGEVVVSDNGSTDNSKEIAVKSGARVIQVASKGYGAALLAGIKSAKGKYVVMADADDSYALDTLESFYERLVKGADLVIGNRFAGGIEKGAMPFLHKYLGNPVLSWIGRRFFGGEIRDYHCGLRAFDRDKILALDLRTTGMEFASELIVKSQLHNLKIDQVPTYLKKDGRSRSPHLKTWSDGLRHLRFLLLYSPKWLFFYPGLFIFIPSLLVFLKLSFGPFSLGGITFASATFIYASCLMLVSFQIIWFSILAKASSISKGLLPSDIKWEKLTSRISNAWVTFFGSVLVLLGIVLSILFLLKWEAANFGNMESTASTRESLFAVITLSMGMQIIFSQVLFSMIMLKNKLAVN